MKNIYGQRLVRSNQPTPSVEPVVSNQNVSNKHSDAASSSVSVENKISTSEEICDIEDADIPDNTLLLLSSNRLILSDSDFSLIANVSDVESFWKCLEVPSSYHFFHTIFEAVKPFHKFTFSLSSISLMTIPNAGGHSEHSEALSFEIMHRLFGAELLKGEMEIRYENPNWKKTDYLAIFGDNHKIAVSVTRAVGYPIMNEFSEDDAIDLLKKKLVGTLFSTKGVLDSDKWERHILHIFTPTEEIAATIHRTAQSFHHILRSNTIIICTIAGNHPWIFA